MRIAAIALAVFAAGLSTGSVASADSAAPQCWTTAGTADRVVQTRLLWNYTHTATWCGDGTKITSVDAPRVDARAVDPACTWQGVTETRTTRRGDIQETFSMGLFICKTSKNTQEGFNPWVIVTVHPDGGHTADSGTAKAVL